MPQQAPAIPDEILRRLKPGTIERFRRLPAPDQRHLLAVGEALRGSGAPEACWMAGFLHDIGKVHEGCHVHTLDRGLWVITNRIPPLATFIRQQQTMPRLGRGIWIAAHHAALGGAVLHKLGYPEQICALVAHHEDIVMARHDVDLRRLQSADDAAYAIPMYPRSEAHVVPA